MKNKFMFWFIAILIFLVSITSALATSTYYYEDFDDVATANWTNGAVGSSYKLNTTNGYWFGTTANTAGFPKYFNTSNKWTGDGNISAEFFVQVDGTTTDFYKQVGFVWTSSDGSTDGVSVYFRAETNNWFCQGDPTSMACTGNLGNTASLVGSTWYKVYLNLWNQTNGSFTFDYLVKSTDDTTTYIDHTQSFEQSLISGATDITVLFVDKQGAGSTTYADDITLVWDETTVASNFTVSLKDIWDNTGLNNFTAIVNGTTYTTTSGSITTNIVENTGIVNVTFQEANNTQGAFYNRTYLEHDTLTNLIGALFQSEISFNAYSKITNIGLTFDVLANDSYYTYKNVDTFYFWNYTNANQRILLDYEDINYSVNLGCAVSPFQLKATASASTSYDCYNGSSWLNILSGISGSSNHTLFSTNSSIYVAGVNTTNYNYLTAGTHNITFGKEGWYNFTTEITVSPLENATKTLTGAYNSIINITGNRTDSGSAISQFNGYVYNTTISFNESYTTTTSSAVVNVEQGYNYTISIEAENYSTGNINETVKYVYSDALLEFVNFELYLFNSIIVNFYDETTNALLNFVNVTAYFDLISDVYATNTSTTNGTLNLALLSPESYIVRYWAINSTENATDWTNRFYYFTLTNNTYNLIDLYLLKESSEYNITVTVLDQFGDRVVGAYVKALRYDLDTNTYLQTDVAQTDESGQALLDVTYNDQFYKFIVVYNGETLKTTSPLYITSSTMTIYVTLGEDSLEFYQDYGSIEHSLSFNNVTNNFRFTWTDNNGISTNMRLDVYEMKATGFTLLNTTSSTATSGTLLAGIVPENDTLYFARATYTDGDGAEYVLNTLYYELVGSTNWGLFGLFLQLILTGTAILLVRWSIPFAAILAPLTLIMGNLLQLNIFPWEALLTLQIVGIIFAFIHSKGGTA